MKAGCRRVHARGEQTTLSAPSLCQWVIRRETSGRPDSTESIPVGVAEKQSVVHLWTLRQNVSRRLTYLLVVFFSFFFFFFLINSLLCLKVQKTHAALAMEIKNL